MEIYVARSLALGASIVAVLWPGPAHAGAEAGIAAFRSADYQAALKELAPAASAGEPSAAFTLGQMYAAGLGVPKDPLRAIELFRAAAAKGHGESQHSLGTALFLGEGTAQDMAEGLKWLMVASDAGLQKARDYVDQVGPRLTPALMAEARKRAREWQNAQRQTSEADRPGQP